MQGAEILRAYSGSPWEKQAGYCRALRCGGLILTSGTLAVDSEGVMQGESCYEQCCYIFRKLEKSLKELGSDLSCVIKVVAYLTDLADGDEFLRALAEYLGDAHPAATAVAVSGLFGSGGKVEIELVATVNAED